MSISMTGNSVAEFLSSLEQREARLLVWGMVDGSFSFEEVEQAADDFLLSYDCKEFEDGYEFVRELRNQRLLFEFEDNGRLRFRTRMAETVRLMARLRQLFPNHMTDRRWMAAPTLVADYRFLVRPRTYPRRHIDAEFVEKDLNGNNALTPVQVSVLRRLLIAKDGTSIKLASFQLRAAHRILAQTGERRSSGTIVSAGTGSGKTTAFYLPAYVHLAEGINDSRWTRCLAIYPRNELLKDQLLDAFRQARHIDKQLLQHKKRKLVLGALFGSTPYNCSSKLSGWVKTHDGNACPFMPCPKCGADLVWSDADRERRVERLCCATSICKCEISSDELILTRESMIAHPPDILFTTTEMLNQRMGDSEIARLFGLFQVRNRRPELVLLDEVHTYEGTTGAQVALLLRRWRLASGSQPHFVGLSATLASAEAFFAKLVGLRAHEVQEAAAFRFEDSDAPVREGMEYMLVLRGDPVSGASLLATTIQASMLLRRILEPRGNVGGKAYGRKVFLFTDALDVTNRLFYYLLSAEGMDGWGNPDLRQPGGAIGSLANLRSSGGLDSRMRFEAGQTWKLCEDIGHNLAPGNYVIIGRTSSQDTGVAAKADLIVATASLEVGFNDPDVGAVLQHKAPHNAAQFLQRKGRAGRSRSMRPWTVVVLSDFGRDRYAYQAYDMLFDPEVPPRDLPVRNSHVLRMQAVFAFFDWISPRLQRVSPGNVWDDFAKPVEGFYHTERNSAKRRQEEAAEIVQHVLNGGDARSDLAAYLQEALGIGKDRVDALMWDPPRALLTNVLPTLLRRLRSQWTKGNNPGEDTQARNPLPEFVPAALFSDLNLPEVVIKTPAQQRDSEAREDPMPVLQGMREFAPGRISRRFGIKNAYARHWIAPPSLLTTDTDQQLSLSSHWIEYDELGTFQMEGEGGPVDLRCVRPIRLSPVRPNTQNVQDFSNANLVWQTQICRHDEGYLADLPSPFRWSKIIMELRFFTLSQNSSVEVRRFATASQARIRLRNGGGFDATIQFVSEHSTPKSPVDPVGVGFVLDVDALLIRCQLPTVFPMSESPADLRLLGSLRTAYFRELVLQCPELAALTNVFQREWLAQIYMAALIYQSIARGVSLDQTWSAAQNDPDMIGSSDVLEVIFQSLWSEADDTENSEGDVDGGEGGSVPANSMNQRRQLEILALLQSADVLQRLHQHAPVLWSTPEDSWRNWLQSRYKATLAAAVIDALHKLCPDLDTGDLIVDLKSGPQATGAPPPSGNGDEIWIAEKTVGGGGVIEKVLERYSEDPRRFFDLVESALEPSDYEVTDQQLSVLLDWASSEEASTDEVRRALIDMRESATHDETAESLQKLVAVLHRRGMLVCHPVVAAINARIVRSNSSVKTDRLLNRLVRRWDALEQTLGVEIEAKIFSYVASQGDDLEAALDVPTQALTPQTLRQWRYNTIYGLLWPRGEAIRRIGLAISNPFAALPLPERELVRRCLDPLPPPIEIESVDWKPQALERLANDGLAILRSKAESTRRLRKEIIMLLAEPVESGYLLLYPKVLQIRRDCGWTDVMLELSGALQ